MSQNHIKAGRGVGLIGVFHPHHLDKLQMRIDSFAPRAPAQPADDFVVVTEDPGSADITIVGNEGVIGISLWAVKRHRAGSP
jgi:hypothetical protein